MTPMQSKIIYQVNAIGSVEAHREFSHPVIIFKPISQIVFLVVCSGSWMIFSSIESG